MAWYLAVWPVPVVNSGRSANSAIFWSTRFLNEISASAIAAFSAIIAEAQLTLEPGARNSKRLPVKAKGDVRLRSVLSMIRSGICGISISSTSFELSVDSLEFASAVEGCCSSLSSNSVNWVPKKELMMAGGASLPPRRWAFVALMIEAFSRPL